MSILVLNGSPKSGASNTMKLTNAFLEGLNRKDIEIIDIAKANIQPCKGCYVCWTSTPGKCCITDDMHSLSERQPSLFQKSIDAELIIWSFPIYCYGMPSQIKAFMDRRLPAALPFIEEKKDGGSGHPRRFNFSEQRHVLISTGGLATIENNFDALIKQFDIAFTDKYEKILCPQGELFRVPELKGKTDDYLTLVKQAGIEYSLNREISAETKSQLAEPLFPKDVFMEMANASWQIAETENTEKTSSQASSQQSSAGERLLRQMSAIYSPSPNAPKEDKTIEFFFTDTNETYQLQVKDKKSVFVKEDSEFKPYSIRIETPFTVWQDISKGALSGQEALFQNKYRVLGEFDLMTTLMDGFSVKSSKQTQLNKDDKSTAKKRSMLILLIPFMVMWIFLPVLENIGAYAAILVSAFVPLLTKFYRLSPYDRITPFIVNSLSIAFLAGLPLSIIITLSYLLFALMWLVSLFCKIPLCAWYSSNSYNGDEAFNNPLFISTNRIIATFWGLLYLGTTVFTWFMMQSVYASLIGLFNSIAPAIAGVFTAVFVKWYPAYFARKKARVKQQ